jgi:hypothetical protein
MSQPIDADQLETPDAPPDRPEEIDALPVLADGGTLIQARRVAGALGDRGSAAIMIPAVQAAAVAAGGFVAGAAVVGLVQRRHRRSAALAKGRRSSGELGRGARRSRRSGRAAELVQIVGSRSLLVDVHLLGGSDTDG